VKRSTIPLPPLAEQRRIAKILDAADALRTKRREALAQLDSLLQSTFLDMFGDPVTNPKGWEMSALREVLKVSSGNGLVAKQMAPDGEFAVYGGNGINGYHDEYMYEEPRIVLGRVGVYCGAVHLTEPKSWVTDTALVVREILAPVDRTYLVFALREANLNQYANQASQPLISGSRIYPVKILMPPLDLQMRFGSIVESIDEHRIAHRTHLAELDTLFASLQSRAFRGEFDAR
jgi:type I restriction enzyme S subunit